MDIIELRRLLCERKVNPYDLLQIALEYLVNTDLSKGCRYVNVDEINEGFQAMAALSSGSLQISPLIYEVATVEVKILQDPDLWRLSDRYERWRQRLTEGFQR